MNDYADRRLTHVSVHSVSYVPGQEPGISCVVQFQVSAIDGGEHGPRTVVEFFVPTPSREPLATQAEQAVLRALDLLQQIGQSDRDEAKRLLHAPPDIDFEKR